MKKEILTLIVALGILGCNAEKNEKEVVKEPVKEVVVKEVKEIKKEEEVAVKEEEVKKVEKVLGEIKLTEAEKDLSVRNVEAKNGIVASAHPLASKIGIEILKNGGNAIDAAVGASFMLGLVEPNASGPGGGGYMLINKDDDQKLYSFYNQAPEGLTLEKWREIYHAKKHLTTGVGFLVPGQVAGLLKALEEQGTMDIKDILAPIIKIAEEGFVITPTLATMMSDNFEKLSMHEETSSVFLSEGLPYAEGEIFKNPDYANTLKLIAEKGRDGFYKGEIAESILAENPLMSQKDLDNYKVLVLDPVETKYKDYTVISTNPESSGVSTLQLINMVESYDLEKLGENNPRLYHYWAEAMNLTHADRYEYVADATIEDVPVEKMISQEYADERRGEIQEKLASGKVQPGNLKREISKDVLEDKEGGSTSHISIVDKDGNAVSMTNTVGSFFGYGVVPEDTGFIMNTHLSLFSETDEYPINVVKNQKKPLTGMAPAMVLDKDGKVELVIGTPGGGRIPSVTPYIISNVVDHDMSIQEAINFPRIHKLNGTTYIENRLDQEIIDYLKRLGHKVEDRGAMSNYFGGVHAIHVTDDGLEGGADPRRDGKALGY